MSSKKKTISKLNNESNEQIITKVDKDSDKYKIALKFVNKILVNIGKDEIDDLTKFMDIDREDIIKEVNKDSLKEMESELFPLFDKNKCNYYRKTDNLVLNCLRGIIRQVGLTPVNIKKDITTTINGQNYRKTHMIYSIN